MQLQTPPPPRTSDPYNLARFLDAQATDYQKALSEIRQGRKTSHWIWYIFPQLRTLGRSQNATYYGLANLAEAKAYLENPTLRSRLLEISEALLSLESNNIQQTMGSSIDAQKLQSSMTLFLTADPTLTTLQKILEKFYHNQPDQTTLNLIK